MKKNFKKALDLFLAPYQVGPINPEGFYGKVTSLLVNDIAADIGGDHASKITKAVNALYAIKLWVDAQEYILAQGRSSKQSVRTALSRYDRSRRNVQHSINSLRRAEKLLRDQVGEVNPKWIRDKFARPLQNLERLEQELAVWEATFAALIHPRLRSSTEKVLAAKTRHKLHHPEFSITEGSADLQYRAVDLVDEQLQQLTGGSSHHVNRFIADFFHIAWNRTVSESNVKTMRQRIKDKKNLGPKNPHDE
jgi:hypothetical protein